MNDINQNPQNQVFPQSTDMDVPPNPVGQNQQQVSTVDSQPNQFSQNTQTQIQPPPVATNPGLVVPPSPAKNNVKKLVYIVFGFLLLVLIGFVTYKYALPLFMKEKVKTITWWGLWEEPSIVEPLIKEYEENNPNVNIEYVKQSPQDYRERLVNALAKGQGPDIFRFHNTWVPMLKGELDNVPASFMTPADFAQKYYPIISSDVSSGSGLVGVPLGFDALTMFINEDLFAQASIEMPKTWDDVRVAAKALTKTENDKIVQSGIAMGRTENVDHWPEIVGLLMIQNSANLLEPTDKRAQDAIVFFTNFANLDLVWDETLPSSTVYFANGKLAMYLAPSWRAFNIKELNPNLKFKTIPLPQVPKDNPEEKDVSYATYWIEGVSAKSSNKDIAWDFLKFMSTKEALDKFFANASNYRGFGEAYPTKENAQLLAGHPVLGSIVTMAPVARSWYLADRTFDGPTGINSRINKYFEDAINSVNLGDPVEKVVDTLAKGINEVLSQYGLVRRSQPVATPFE